MKKYKITTKCLSCESKSLKKVFSITHLPLADQLNTHFEEKTYEVPLTLVKCNNCNLVFISELVNPEFLFPQNYPYFTSVSSVLVKHFNDLAKLLYEKYHLSAKSLVIDIGSNDGTALKFFKNNGVSVLGIDPTTKPALKAILSEIPTLRAFWNSETAEIVGDEIEKKADLIMCNNVISHVNNPADFINSLNFIVNEQTTIVAEFPYLKSMIENNAFDIIFHQHVSYFTLNSFEHLISKHGFYLNDAEVLNVHGGNLRVFFSTKNNQSAKLKEFKHLEQKGNINHISTLNFFIENINQIKEKTTALLDKLNAEGFKIMGYGAAGKATTFLKHFEIDQNRINGIIDKNTFKQNKYFPAYNHKIYPIEILDNENLKPDYILILAWTLKDEIVADLNQFKSKGGKFIIALPNLQVI